MIPLLLLRFTLSITNDSLLLLRFILSITNDSPTTVEIYLIYYEWFPYYCWDLSDLLQMIPLLLLRFIWSIKNDSPTTAEIYLI